MRPFLLLLFLCSFLDSAVAQLTGRLIKQDGQPLPAASVVLYRQVDSVLLKGTHTNEEGIYHFTELPVGMYWLQFSYAGWQTLATTPFEITAGQAAKEMGVYEMREDTGLLNQVVVRATRPLYQQSPEGTVINVESSVLTKGSSVLQVLERSPGVVIDYRNNTISLHGKTGVVVMLNGKTLRISIEQLVTMLGNMSADNIDKIELLTAPGARYDADGNAGMINIVLKKNKALGTWGSFSATAGYGMGAKAKTALNLSHNGKRLRLNGSYAYGYDHGYGHLQVSGYQNFAILGGPMTFVFEHTNRPVQQNHDASVGLEYTLSPKLLVGGSVILNRSKMNARMVNQALYNILPDSLLVFNADIDYHGQWNNLISSLYLERKWKEEEKLAIDMEYMRYVSRTYSGVASNFEDEEGTPKGSNNDTVFAPVQRSFSNNSIKVGVVKLDYNKGLNKKIKAEAGFKATYTTNNSDAGIESLLEGHWVNRSGTANLMRMQEAIAAAYASVAFQLPGNSKLTIGTRYEYSRTQIENLYTGKMETDRKLGKFFPALFYTRPLNDHTELQLSFNKRIARPSYNDLASYVNYSDPIAVVSGNPMLRPTITDNLKVGISYDGYSLSLQASKDQYPIYRYQLTKGTTPDLLYVSPQNPRYQYNLVLQVNAPITITNWWSINAGFTGGWRKFRLEYTLQPVVKAFVNYNINATQVFKLPKEYTIELSGWYNSAAYNAAVNLDGVGMMSAGVKKELAKNRGSLQLTITDPFTMLHSSGGNGELTPAVFEIRNRFTYTPEFARFPVFRISYIRSFGGTGKESSRREVGAKEEMQRAAGN